MSDALSRYREVWQAKPVLREIYSDFYRRIAARCVDGTTLEVGGGIGNLKTYLSNVITTDIQYGPWLDVVADAQQLPFRDGSLGNVVMVDVLHHIERPLVFLRECGRALRPGGRIVAVEPAITPLSYGFYRFIHPEPVIMAADPLEDGPIRADRDPYESNQAIPTLLATRDRDRFHKLCPELAIVDATWFALLGYPLSGGFKTWSLLPRTLASGLLKLERLVEPFVGRALGFRVLLVIEKRAAP